MSLNANTTTVTEKDPFVDVETFVVIGQTNVARQVCASVSNRGHQVSHLAAPDDDDLKEILTAGPIAVAVLTHDDVVALRYALAVAHLQPATRLVVTIFDRTVGEQLGRLLPNCHVTSPAALAVPTLAGPCLDRGLLAVQATETGPRCVVADTDTPTWRPIHLPRQPWITSRIAQLTELFASHDPGIRILMTGLLGILTVLCADWMWLVLIKGHLIVDAFKESVQVVTTVGPAEDSGGNHLYSVLTAFGMLATILFTAMFTAGVVERLLGPRLLSLVGTRALPRSGHVVVVGLGQVGLRLCLELKALGVPVVAVERDPGARNLRLVRSLKIPTIVGHGGDRQVLERIGVHRALALAAVGSDELDNIAVAVAAQAVHPDLRLVLRAGEQEALAETRSLFPLGITRDVTVLSATYVSARLLGISAHGIVSSGLRTYLETPEAGLIGFPTAARHQCRHVSIAKPDNPLP